MKTYNEIKKAIESLSSTVRPSTFSTHKLMHSDGLTQSHREDVYEEPIKSIRSAIWSGQFSMQEKQELNEYLVSKLSK